MKNIIKLLAVAAVAAAVTQTANAAFISGNLGFSGAVTVNSTQASLATMVTANGFSPGVVVGPVGSSFSAFGVADGNTVNMTSSSWNFNDTSTKISSFWTIDGFEFDLTSSLINPGLTGGTPPNTGITVIINGTVSGNGFQPTAFSGQLSFQDPSVPTTGTETFTGSFSFNPVPDGASTVLLLGTALSGLALLKRKFVA